MKFKNVSLCLIAIPILCLIAVSCYSPVDGCLDPESTNYGITADRDCDGCCDFPNIKLSVFHQNGDTTLSLGDTLINDLGQEYSIIKYAYLLSDFKMTTSDNESYEVLDSIQLNVDDVGTIFVKDDVIRVTRNVFSYDFGTIIFDGDGKRISFDVGLSPLLDTASFTTPVANHPLTEDPDSLYQEMLNGYVFQRVQVAQGESFKDTVVYDVKGENNVASVEFEVEYNSIRGNDKTIIIEARYNKWFDEVDFETMNKSDIEAKMAESSKTMFNSRL